MGTWDKELQDPKTYRAIFEKLAARGDSRRDLLASAPVETRLNLAWILRHETQVIREITKGTRKDNWKMAPHQISKVFVGKLRDFYIASWPDRILLMAMATILARETNSQVSPQVFSFRPGKGAADAQKSLLTFVRQNRSASIYFLNRDISKYGDSIPQDILWKELSRRTAISKNPVFEKLLMRGVRIEFFPKTNPQCTATLFRGIPSGSPLVPVLENFYLGSLDDALTALPNSFYARYGDDFIFASPDEAIILEADLRIEKIVSELGLSIKDEKKINYSFFARQKEGFKQVQSFDWLGRRINSNGTLGPKRDHFKYLRKEWDVQVDYLTKRHGTLSLDDDFKKELLKISLSLVLSVHRGGRFSNYLFSHENHGILRQFDRHIVHELHRKFQSNLGLSKKIAWRELRKLRLPSTSRLLTLHRQKGQK